MKRRPSSFHRRQDKPKTNKLDCPDNSRPHPAAALRAVPGDHTPARCRGGPPPRAGLERPCHHETTRSEHRSEQGRSNHRAKPSKEPLHGRLHLARWYIYDSRCMGDWVPPPQALSAHRPVLAVAEAHAIRGQAARDIGQKTWSPQDCGPRTAKAFGRPTTAETGYIMSSLSQ